MKNVPFIFWKKPYRLFGQPNICSFVLIFYGSVLLLVLVNYAADKSVRSSPKATQGEWEAPACTNLR